MYLKMIGDLAQFRLHTISKTIVQSKTLTGNKIAEDVNKLTNEELYKWMDDNLSCIENSTLLLNGASFTDLWKNKIKQFTATSNIR